MLVLCPLGFDERFVVRALSDGLLRGAEHVLLLLCRLDDQGYMRSKKVCENLQNILRIAGIKTVPVELGQEELACFERCACRLLDELEARQARSVEVILGGGIRLLNIYLSLFSYLLYISGKFDVRAYAYLEILDVPSFFVELPLAELAQLVGGLRKVSPKLLEVLLAGEIHLQELARRTGLPASSVLAQVKFLEQLGAVRLELRGRKRYAVPARLELLRLLKRLQS
ncbi:MAG: winged helix-turn-helix transcriptional regulator [bacterium]|nr:winged helix-turn-helix transcriptional regulator [bacterium]